MKLEPGMRVRCVKDDNFGRKSERLTNGKEYIVGGVTLDFVRIIDDRGSYGGWLRERFKPVVRVKMRRSPPAPMFDPDMLERALAWFERLTPAEKEAHRQAQTGTA